MVHCNPLLDCTVATAVKVLTLMTMPYTGAPEDAVDLPLQVKLYCKDLPLLKRG